MCLEVTTGQQLKAPSTRRAEDAVFTVGSTPYHPINEAVIASLFPMGFLRYWLTHNLPSSLPEEEKLQQLFQLYSETFFSMSLYGAKEPMFSWLERVYSLRHSLAEVGYTDIDIGGFFTPDALPQDSSHADRLSYMLALDLSDLIPFFQDATEDGLNVHPHYQFFTNIDGLGDLGGLQITFPTASDGQLHWFTGMGIKAITLYSQIKKYLFDIPGVKLANFPTPRMDQLVKITKALKKKFEEISGEHRNTLPRSAVGVRMEVSMSIPTQTFKKIIGDRTLTAIWIHQVSRLFNIAHLRDLLGPGRLRGQADPSFQFPNTMTIAAFSIGTWMERVNQIFQRADEANAFKITGTGSAKPNRKAEKYFALLALAFGYTNHWLYDHAAVRIAHRDESKPVARAGETHAAVVDSDVPETPGEPAPNPSVSEEPLTPDEMQVLASGQLSEREQFVFAHTKFRRVATGADRRNRSGLFTMKLTFIRAGNQKSPHYEYSTQGKVQACRDIIKHYFLHAPICCSELSRIVVLKS